MDIYIRLVNHWDDGDNYENDNGYYIDYDTNVNFDGLNDFVNIFYDSTQYNNKSKLIKIVTEDLKIMYGGDINIFIVNEEEYGDDEEEYSDEEEYDDDGY